MTEYQSEELHTAEDAEVEPSLAVPAALRRSVDEADEQAEHPGLRAFNDRRAEHQRLRDAHEGGNAMRGALGGFLLGAAAWAVIALGIYLLLR